MPTKRYRLPQVAFFQGLEAAGRNLGFIKALPFSATFTTFAFDNSSLRRLEINT
jgi:hypothetical protein